MNEEDLIFVAGALDYNNSIRMLMRRRHVAPHIHVANTDHRRIQLLCDVLGGAFAVRGNNMAVFQRSHSSAVEVVRKIRPYLRLSLKVADQILAWKPMLQPPAQPRKVLCPNECGNLMLRGSRTCLPCYEAGNQTKRWRPKKSPAIPVVEVEQEPETVIDLPSSPWA